MGGGGLVRQEVATTLLVWDVFDPPTLPYEQKNAQPEHAGSHPGREHWLGVSARLSVARLGAHDGI